MNGLAMETPRQSFGRSWRPNAALRCALVLALGAPLLGGCAASHVGNTWQCPLIQGQPCVSVADADPAGAGAQRTGARQTGARAGNTGAIPVSEPPLYRTASIARDRTGETAAAPPRPGCRAGCRAFAWLRRLGRHGTEAPPDGGVGEADTDTGEPGEPPEMPHAGTPAVGDLRTPEVIGRIWIAPYVDAHGVYHEASWVRVVFEPSGWKHP